MRVEIVRTLWAVVLPFAVWLGPQSVSPVAAACTYSISPTNRVHGYGATTNSVSVATVSGCAWTVVNTNNWITILSPTNGLGPDIVSYAVDANLNVNWRTGVVMIADQFLTLSQQPTPCTYSISPTNRVHGYGASTNSVSVSTASGCAWTVVNTNSWIRILSPTNGVGSGSMSYAVDANQSVNWRTGVVMIADQFLTLSQQPTSCTYSISPTNRVHGYGAATNSVSLTTASGCVWTVLNTNSWITILSPTNGLSSSSVSYAVNANLSVNWRTGVVMIADQFLTLSQQPTPCAYSISPTNRVHGYGAATNSVSLATASGCAWTVVNTNGWITILSPTNGVGSGSVNYAVDANLSVNWRTGVVMVADQFLTLTQQPAACAYSISPTNRVHGYGATTNSVSVTTGSGCAWTVVSTNSWITILSGASGTGGGIVTYAVDANPNPVDRTGVVAIADQIFTILQRAVVCAYDISPTNRVHGFAGATNSVSLTTSSGCSWMVVNTNDWITITSPTSGLGSTIVNYTVASNLSPTDRAGVVMIADQSFNLSQRGYTNSPFAFRAISSSADGHLKLTLMGIPVGVWELQQSPDLIQWQKISNLTNTTGVVEYAGTVPIDANPRFYRAVLPP